MKLLFSFLSVCFFMPLFAKAQGLTEKKKVQWNIEIVDGNEPNQYQIIATAKIEDGWHVFGANPGDEFLIPTHFSFEGTKAELLSTNESGKLITEEMEAVGKVSYYEHEVRFVALVRSLEKEIKGYIEYQLCNKSMCLPPTQENFSFNLK